jgi:hypothetical protein
VAKHSTADTKNKIIAITLTSSAAFGLWAKTLINPPFLHIRIVIHRDKNCYIATSALAQIMSRLFFMIFENPSVFRSFWHPEHDIMNPRHDRPQGKKIHLPRSFGEYSHLFWNLPLTICPAMISQTPTIHPP